MIHFEGLMSDFYKWFRGLDPMSFQGLQMHELWQEFQSNPDDYRKWDRTVVQLLRYSSLFKENGFYLWPKVHIEVHENAFNCSFDEKNRTVYQRTTMKIGKHLWDGYLSCILWNDNHLCETFETLTDLEEIVWDLIGIYRAKFTTRSMKNLEHFREELAYKLEDDYQGKLTAPYVQDYLLPYFVATEEPIPFDYYGIGTMIALPIAKMNAFPPDTIQPLVDAKKIKLIHPKQMQMVAYWIDDPNVALRLKLIAKHYIASATFKAKLVDS